MSFAVPILAASGEDPTVKIIVGVAVAAFWIISQIVGALSKKPDQTLPPSRPKSRPAGAPPMPPMQRPLPPAQSTPSRQQPPQIRRQKPQPQQRRQAPPVRRPEQIASSVPVAMARQSSISRSIEPPAAAAKVMPRREIVGALLKPRNLQKAFILTELLRPPVALRADDDRLARDQR